MTPGPPAGEARWIHRATIIGLIGFFFLVLAPPISRSYPSDDTVLLIPLLQSHLQGRSLLGTFAYLFAPNQPDLPRALWKLYAIVTLGLFGQSNVGLVWVGVALHGASSILVWTLARRLGMTSRIAWFAAGLHFTAYAGFHAYLWPVGVQHVLTVLGVLGVFNLYLAADQRERAGLPFRGHYWATVLVALLSSLSRAPSVIGPVGILAHAVLSCGSARERLRRYDLWRPAMLVSLIYPLALVAYAGDTETLGTFPVLATLLRLIVRHAGPAAAFAVELACAVALLLLVRLALSAAARGSWSVGLMERAHLRLVLWAVAAALAAPWVAKFATVCVWGVEAFLSPLGLALNSHDTARWHMATMPIDLPGFSLAIALLVLFLRHHGRNRDLLVLLVMLVGFGFALYTTESQPVRYWIYVTPVLAVVLAAAIDAACGKLTSRIPRANGWSTAVLLGLWAIVIVSNIAAIRLAVWRHKIADTYQVLDYIRVADFVRQDLEQAGARPEAPICVDGLEPLPHAPQWEWFGDRALFREYNARAILAQALNRSGASGIQLDCGRRTRAGTYGYTVHGMAVLRSGQSVDPFERLHERVRRLVEAGDYRTAQALGQDHARARPFVIRYLLGRLPDDDVVWATNGGSLLTWLDSIAASHDNWYTHGDPKIESLSAMAAAEVRAYLRFLFLMQYVEARTTPVTASWEPVSRRLPFGGVPTKELDAILRSDPLLSSREDMRSLREEIVNASSWSNAKRLGEPRYTPDLDFLFFVARLLVSDYFLP